MSPRRTSVLACALAAALSAAPAPAQQIEVQRHQLANGLQVLTHEDHAIPMISLYVFYRVGSKNERPGITGVSHLFEHMMFNGSGRFKPKEFDLLLETAGAGGNGYTNEDFTAYFETFPRAALETALDLESDRMRSLLVTEANLEQERGIVKEERRVSLDNSPQGRMYEELMAAAYVAHPYGWPVVGWMGDLDAIKLVEAQRYFENYYGPNNATLVLVGDFRTADLMRSVERFFGSIPARGAPEAVVNAEPEQQGERRVTLVKEAALPAVMVGYKSTAASHADAPALEVLATILAYGESSRLYRALVYGGLATNVDAQAMAMAHPSLFYLYAQAGEGKTAEENEAAIHTVLAEIAAGGVTPDELQKAKNQLRARIVRETQTLDGKANIIGTAEMRYGGPTAIHDRVRLWDAVTSDDIRRVVSTYFVPLRRTVVTLQLPAATPEAAR